MNNPILKSFKRMNERYHEGHEKIPRQDMLFYSLQMFTYNLEERDFILDVGCGDGDTIEYFIMNNFRCMGIDASIDNLYLCRKKGFEVYPFDVCNLYMFDNESIDNIFCRSVVNHVYDLDKSLDELTRILKKDGKIFLGVGINKDGKFNPNWRNCFEDDVEFIDRLKIRGIKEVNSKMVDYQTWRYLDFVGVKE